MKHKLITEYCAGGDHTGELMVKEYVGFKLFVFLDYRTMSVTSRQAHFENGKAFEKIGVERWKLMP